MIERELMLGALPLVTFTKDRNLDIVGSTAQFCKKQKKRRKQYEGQENNFGKIIVAISVCVRITGIYINFKNFKVWLKLKNYLGFDRMITLHFFFSTDYKIASVKTFAHHFLMCDRECSLHFLRIYFLINCLSS